MKKQLTPQEYLVKYKKSLGWFANLLCPCYFFGEQIPEDTKFIISNHLQFFDPVFILMHFDKYMRCVSKKETRDFPIIGKIADNIPP